jgi:hypothetical protein
MCLYLVYQALSMLFSVVTNAPIEPVEVQDFKKITHHLRGISRMYLLSFMKKNQIITTCNRLDLETLGS